MLCIIYGLIEFGKVHRDLKLQNIMVKKEGGDAKAILIDFQFSSKLIGETDSVVGSKLYQPPEMKKDGLYGDTFDMWSLGIILYQINYGVDQQTKEIKFPGAYSEDVDEEEFYKKIEEEGVNMDEEKVPKLIINLIK